MGQITLTLPLEFMMHVLIPNACQLQVSSMQAASLHICHTLTPAHHSPSRSFSVCPPAAWSPGT